MWVVGKAAIPQAGINTYPAPVLTNLGFNAASPAALSEFVVYNGGIYYAAWTKISMA